MDTLKRRPTETTTGLALAAAVYGFLTQSGIPNGVAAVLAFLAAFGPALVTAATDRLFIRKGAPLDEAAGEEVIG